MSSTRSPTSTPVTPSPIADDLTADVAARHVRQRDLQRRQPLAQEQIDVIEADGGHADLDLARPGDGIRHLGDLQHLGPAVLAKERALASIG